MGDGGEKPFRGRKDRLRPPPLHVPKISVDPNDYQWSIITVVQ